MEKVFLECCKFMDGRNRKKVSKLYRILNLSFLKGEENNRVLSKRNMDLLYKLRQGYCVE
jgi:hypothetical protein